MTDISKLENARKVIESVEDEARRIAIEEERAVAIRPKLLGSGRFMEVLTIQARHEIINIHSISEAIPTSRLVNGDPINLTRLVFINGEDITVDCPYSEFKAVIKQYFK